MLTIRKEQLEVLDKAAVGDFEAEMVQHLKALNPNHCKMLGDSGVRQVVHLGLKEAKKYGLTNRGPVRLYLECMFFFGSYFDLDPQLPWVTDILIDCQYSSQTPRAKDLCNKTADFVSKVYGPEREFYLEAVQRMTQVSMEGQADPVAQLEDPLIQVLKELFPRKCQYLGESALRKLSQWSIQSAKPLAVYTNKAVALLTVLGFMLGHGVITDPQYPWISAKLKDSAAGTPDARVEQAYKQAQDYLQQTLE
jgi:hypothetical protein